MAIDARLIKSASRPISNDKINELIDKQNRPEAKLDKNGNVKKFSRDLDSDWVVKNDTPHYGIKEHAAVDIENGFILSTNITPASHHDSTYLPYAAIYSMHTDDPIDVVYADKSYLPGWISLREHTAGGIQLGAGAPNRNFLSMNHIADGIMRKDNVNATFYPVKYVENIWCNLFDCINLTGWTETEIMRNKAISKKRYIACPVE